MCLRLKGEISLMTAPCRMETASRLTAFELPTESGPSPGCLQVSLMSLLPQRPAGAGCLPQEKLHRQRPASLAEVQPWWEPSAASLGWFPTRGMQRRLLVHGERVRASGPGPMPAPGRAPGALVTVPAAGGWHPELSREPGVALRAQL